MDVNDTNYQKYLEALQSSTFFKDSSEDSIRQLLKDFKSEEWKNKSLKNSMVGNCPKME